MPDFEEKRRYQIGVISDTHGLLRPEALVLLQGSDLILHAGDIDKHEILETLQRIAPVVAVRGNMDRGEWTQGLPQIQWEELGDILIVLLHDREKLDIDPQAAGVSMVISGHTHLPSIVEVDGVLYLNPGSAGPKRYSKPVSLAKVELEGKEINAELHFIA